MQGSAQAGPWLLPQRFLAASAPAQQFMWPQTLRLCHSTAASWQFVVQRWTGHSCQLQLQFHASSQCTALARALASTLLYSICRPHAGIIPVLTPGAEHLTCLVASARSLIHAAAHPPQHGGALHIVEGVPWCLLLLSPTVQLHLQPHLPARQCKGHLRVEVLEGTGEAQHRLAPGVMAGIARAQVTAACCSQLSDSTGEH